MSLEEARQLWQRGGVNHYEFDIVVRQFVYKSPPVRIRVVNGVETGASYTKTGEVGQPGSFRVVQAGDRAPPEQWQQWATVPLLFQSISDCRPPCEFLSASFDATYGFPVRLHLGHEISDAGYGLEVLNFAELRSPNQ